MTTNASDSMLSQLSDFLAAKTGLHFPAERWRDLERGIKSAAHEFGFMDTESCIQWLVSSPLTRSEIEILASHLTIGETYFFREKRTFAILEEHILPELIRSRRRTGQRLRIWSAGCCTGEEPFSIAILLSQMIPDQKNWNVTILATDINPLFLHKASEGLYSNWSFRETEPWIREKYFQRIKGGREEILPAIQRMVTFSYLNLAEDVYPSVSNNTNAMDVIFCRNVLMYFAPEPARRVVAHLYRSLVEGGWLIVSPSDTSQVLFSEFATVNFAGAILYRKDGRKPASEGAFTSCDQQEPVSLWRPSSSLVVPEPELSVPLEFNEPAPPTAAEPEKTKEGPIPYEEALALYEQGRYAQAAETLEASLSKNQPAGRAMVLLARVYANQGKLPEALAWCEKAVATDKLNPASYFLRAAVLLEQKDVEGARATLKRALYLNPKFVMAHFALANLAQRLGKFAEAGKHFENALALLGQCRSEEELPEADGMTAGRLMEIIRSTSRTEMMA